MKFIIALVLILVSCTSQAKTKPKGNLCFEITRVSCSSNYFNQVESVMDSSKFEKVEEGFFGWTLGGTMNNIKVVFRIALKCSATSCLPVGATANGDELTATDINTVIAVLIRKAEMK